MAHKQIPAEALINLRQRLDLLPSRCQERSILVTETATLYGVSKATLYRLLRQHSRPKAINRSDSGTPRKLSPTDMELYCEIIAAIAVFVTKNITVFMEKMLKQHYAFYLMP